jgi:hypothetical protein
MIDDREMPYVQQLVDAYGERDNCVYGHHGEVTQSPNHGPHFSMQRERFFDADAFMHFYRDNTSREDIGALRKDIYHGVFDTHHRTHSDSLARVDAVMNQASNISPSGILAKYAGVPVKQGICHHFANEGRLRWQKS